MKEFDIEKLERKNIYKVPDDLFENIQSRVMSEVKTEKKAPVFKLKWMYAAAASIALIFGVTYVFNSDSDPALQPKAAYAADRQGSATEGELAYETLKSDLTSVENTNQTAGNQTNNSGSSFRDNGDVKETARPVKAVSKKEETQMNEYLDSFSNSEIAELASNSTQDVYLDLYN